MDCSLSDMVIKNGDWNLDFFCLWLSEDIIHQIVGVPPPQPNSDVERIRTGLGSDTASGTCGHNYDSVIHVVKASLYWAKQYVSLSGSQGIKISRSDFVPVSSNCWVYLNTDGSVKYVDMFATGGGLLRDHNGTWIVGFTRYLGNCEVIDSELWGVLDGLQITLDRSFRKVIIRTNNLEAVNLIHEGVREGSNSALITRILLFLKLLSH
ncbi:hypothetical protein Gorai_016393 [Gossypium raimondii]|uniref:RNase H type-1 domain-containing protein n=1 Tax=Gossypium raimondii TaxID=29730 RepID=A0A7J8P8N8_GOSRA|nr:hypothetical protein [Gossypium raimondii]